MLGVVVCVSKILIYISLCIRMIKSKKVRQLSSLYRVQFWYISHFLHKWDRVLLMFAVQEKLSSSPHIYKPSIYRLPNRPSPKGCACWPEFSEYMKHTNSWLCVSWQWSSSSLMRDAPCGFVHTHAHVWRERHGYSRAHSLSDWTATGTLYVRPSSSACSWRCGSTDQSSVFTKTCGQARVPWHRMGST